MRNSLTILEISLNDLLKRVIFAVPAATLFLYITWLGGWYFKGLVILIGFFIQKEIIRILDDSGSPADMFFPYTIGLWVMLSPFLPYSLEIGIGIFLLFITLQIFQQDDQSISRLASTFFAGIYAPLGLLCLILIRDMGTAEEGFVLTLALMLMVWGNDIFAYFGGKFFGKHSLAKQISPNKTWEGFISGYLGSIVGLTIALLAVPLNTPISLTLALPVVLAVGTFGPVGDLLESKLKRKAGVKDSSSLLPGHGGFFDRFDALLLAAPAAYLYFIVLRALGYVWF